MSTPTVLFVDADGNPVEPTDPAAVSCEITETGDDGTVTRTYATVNVDVHAERAP